jgi:hypothetical protein
VRFHDDSEYPGSRLELATVSIFLTCPLASLEGEANIVMHMSIFYIRSLNLLFFDLSLKFTSEDEANMVMHMSIFYNRSLKPLF